MKFREPAAIIFDLGRVLVNVDVKAGFFAYFKARGKSVEAVISEIMESEAVAAFNKGELEPQAFYRRLCERYQQTCSFEEFRQMWCDVFSSMPGMDELVQAVKQRFLIGMLSDTDPLHWDYICRHYPVVELFDKPTLSFQTGYRKPDRRAFLTAAQMLGTSPEDCIYIDDLAVNVRAAAETGMDAIQFYSASQLRQELVRRRVLKAEDHPSAR